MLYYESLRILPPNYGDQISLGIISLTLHAIHLSDIAQIALRAVYFLIFLDHIARDDGAGPIGHLA